MIEDRKECMAELLDCKPVVSVIRAESVPILAVYVPAYNAGLWIDDCIRSVLNQRCQDFTLVVIDDGSQDDTLKRVRAYEGDGRVRVISDGVNRGLVARLNESIKMCRSPYYVRMDADDVMHPERLSRQLEILEECPGFDFCVTAACVIDENSRVLGVRHAERPDARQALVKGACVHPTLMARLNFMQRNLYCEDYDRAEDREFFLRHRNWERGYYLDQPLLYYRSPQIKKVASLITGYKMERKIIAHYGPELIGHGRTAVALTCSWAKERYVSIRGVKSSGVHRSLDMEKALLSECEHGLKQARTWSDAQYDGMVLEKSMECQACL